MNEYKSGRAACVGSALRLEKNLAGELYRHVADRRGIFVQPARFEAFGLTIIEAMASGLPVFATCYGGPREIIQHGVSGYHFDPNHGSAAAAAMADFFERSAADPDVLGQDFRNGFETGGITLHMASLCRTNDDIVAHLRFLEICQQPGA